jgi:mono/diheme cytochrome c family protein
VKLLALILLVCIIALPAFAANGTPLEQQSSSPRASAPNPFAGNERARRAGAKLYRNECAACHGENLEGYGKALPLTSAEVQNAAPGALFVVLTNGSLRGGMPSFASLPEPRRWQIVEYLKSR